MERRDEESDEKAARVEAPERRPVAFKPISASKLQAVEKGSIKKNPFLIHKEKAELRKKQESEDTVKVYEEFVASFSESKTSFVPERGSSRPRHEQHRAPPPLPSKTPRDNPSPFVKRGQGTSTLTAKYIKQSLEEDDDDEEDALALKLAKSQKRNLDTFQAAKQEPERPLSRQRTTIDPVSLPEMSHINATSTAWEERQGSHDTGDMSTTNLYIGNISPKVDEQSLCQEFAVYGPIASVKIMWPRKQEEQDRNRNCGFVSFMNRADAERALKALHLKDLAGHALNVGWGKPVPLPSKPYFVLEKHHSESQDPRASLKRATIDVEIPQDVEQTNIIHRVIERVIHYGSPFEVLIMKRERENPKFNFLFDNNSKEHIYYRWRLYSLLQGESTVRWRTEPFQMIKDGPWWTPPEVPFTDDHAADVFYDSEDERQERAPKGVLGNIARRRFETMVRQVTFKRGTIANAMAFAIEHADAADEVVTIVRKSILLPQSAISVKLARLYLVSDILHNSGADVKNAWMYRRGLESQLPAIFEHFNFLYRSIRKLLQAEQLRRHIVGILHIWQDWMVFPATFIQDLEDIFMKKPKISRETAAEETQRVEKTSETEQEKGGSNGDAQQSQWGAVNNEPLDNDGEPLSDVDGEPLSDVDGEPMSDVDGEPMSDADEDTMNNSGEEQRTGHERNETNSESNIDMFSM